MSQSPNSADLVPGDLAGQVAVDGFAAALQCRLADIGQRDFEAGERADMSDPGAHLPGANHADAAQPVQLSGKRHPRA